MSTTKAIAPAERIGRKATATQATISPTRETIPLRKLRSKVRIRGRFVYALCNLNGKHPVGLRVSKAEVYRTIKSERGYTREVCVTEYPAIVLIG